MLFIEISSMENIDKHIEQNIEILGDSMLSPQSRRHKTEELDLLRAYKVDHPEDEHDPTALELYCYQNPSAPECKKYDV